MSRWGRVLLAGLVLGIAATVADSLIHPGPAYAYTRALSMVLNAASVWAGLGILAGWLVRRPLSALLAGPLALVVAVLAYYAYGVTLGDRLGVESGEVLATGQHWILYAVLIGPVLGLIGALMRRPGWIGLLACMVLPLGVAYDMTSLHHLDAGSFRLEPVYSSAQLATVALAVLLVVLSRRPVMFAHSESATVQEHVGWEQG